MTLLTPTDVLTYPTGNWSPALQIRTILLSIQALLADPNPDDPLNEHVAKQWKENKTEAQQTAREWTRQYAQPQSGAS